MCSNINKYSSFGRCKCACIFVYKNNKNWNCRREHLFIVFVMDFLHKSVHLALHTFLLCTFFLFLLLGYECGHMLICWLSELKQLNGHTKLGKAIRRFRKKISEKSKSFLCFSLLAQKEEEQQSATQKKTTIAMPNTLLCTDKPIGWNKSKTCRFVFFVVLFLCASCIHCFLLFLALKGIVNEWQWK